MEQHARLDALETRLRFLSARIEDLEHRLRVATPKTRESCREELEELIRRRKLAGQQLADVRIHNAAAVDGEDLLDGIFSILDDIGGRIDRLVSRRSNPGPGS